MSDCQCLHPDDEDSDFCGEEEDYPEGVEEFEDSAAGEGFYTGEEGLSHMTPQGEKSKKLFHKIYSVGEDTSDAAG